MSGVSTAARRGRPATVRPPAAPTWPLSIALLAALIVATGSITPLLNELWWWVLAATVALVVTAAMIVTRLVLRGRYWPLLVGVVALLVTLTLFYAPGQSLLGVIPVPQTFDHFAQLVNEGALSIGRQKVPANPVEGIQFIIGLAVGSVAILLDLLGVIWRRPALTGIPLLAIVAAPTFIAADLVDAFFFLLTGIAWLVALHVSSPFANRRGAAAIGGASLVTALVLQLIVAPLAPDPLNTARAPGYVPGLNPIINLGENLRRDDPVQALRYVTETINPVYMTISTLGSFTDDGWVDSLELRGEQSPDLFDIARAPGMGEDVVSEEYETTISVLDISGQSLPVPYAPTSIEGVDGEWRWDSETLNIRTSTSTVRGQEYTVQSGAPFPSVRELQTIGNERPTNVERYLVLPDDLPPVISDTAETVARNAETRFDKARALQAYFRGSSFTYSETAPVERNYDGTDADIIAEFLDVRAGYCAHFASSMAVMARALDIPARVSVGFAPGYLTSIDGVEAYTLTTDNLHAWPELYFEGIGWIRFEPTPGIGSIPTFPTGENPDEEDPEPNPSLTPEPADTPSPTPAPSTSAQTPLTPEEQEALEESLGRTGPSLWLPIGIAAALLLLVLIPATVRGVVRSRRRSASATGDALAAWDELADTARDLRIDISDTGTPRELEQRLTEVLEPDVLAIAALVKLRAVVESTVYSGDAVDGVDLRADLDRAIRGLRRSRPRAIRARASVAPESLAWRVVNRRRAPRDGDEFTGA